MELDNICAKYFFENQSRLFKKPVAESVDEALEFLEDCMASVFKNKKELEAFLKDEGVDVEGDVTDELEVFELPDGRFLYVEA